MSRGVIYIATGARYIAEALNSAASLKRYMRDLPVTLHADQPVASPYVDEVVPFAADGYLSRIPRLASSPYQRTLFLDSDTYVCGEISALFDVLDAFEIAAAHAPIRSIYEVDGVPDSFPEFNAGVILFRRSAEVQALFADWADLFAQFRQQVERGEVRWLRPADRRIPAHDQGALRQALYRSRLRIATLPPEYNCRFTVPGYVDGPVKILHGRAPDLSQVAAGINAATARRGYEERAGALRLRHYIEASSDTYSLANIRYTLHRRGIWWTARAALRSLMRVGRPSI